MSLIEGVGDEVTQFVFILLCILVGMLAWWTTGYRPDRFRTVVVMERNAIEIYTRANPRPFTIRFQRIRDRNRQMSQLLSQGAQAQSNAGDTAHDNVSANESHVNHMESTEINSNNVETLSEVAEDTPVVSSSQEQIQEMNDIVSAMDSPEPNIVRNRRLAFFNVSDSEAASEVAAADSCANINTPTSRAARHGTFRPSRNIRNIIRQHTNQDPLLVDGNLDDEAKLEEPPETKKDEKGVETNENVLQTKVTEGENPVKVQGVISDDSIRIKLKYLNDDLKLVEGSLHEPLGEFKRRHFTSELSARQLVRFIFNGRVLAREADTLRACGLYDNCVVHCLVHQPRNQQQQIEQNESFRNFNGMSDTGPFPSGLQNEEGMMENDVEPEPLTRDWDMEHLLFTLVSVALTIAWYCQCQYSALFGTTASVALFGLTAIYGIAVVGVYFPDPIMQRIGNNPPQQNENQGTRRN